MNSKKVKPEDLFNSKKVNEPIAKVKDDLRNLGMKTNNLLNGLVLEFE